MYPRQKLAIALFIAMGVLVGLAIVNHFVVYAGEPYEISIVKSHLVLALDTHNIEAKVGYIDGTVIMLENYHGNSQWWYPTQVSDIDQTRELLKTVSNDVKAQLDVKERDQYFILPHNELVKYMNSEIGKSSLRLDSYASGAYYHPENNIMHYISFAGVPTLLVVAMLFAISGDSYSYQRAYDKKQDDKRRAEEEAKRQREIQDEADRREKLAEENRAKGQVLPKGF